MKKICRFITFVLCLALVLPYAALASEYEQEGAVAVSGSVSAESYMLMDADTGAALAASGADVRLPMASTTKMMTCLVALEKGDISSKVTIPKEAVGIEGSSVYLVQGESLTLEELLYALMLESANDAAVAIALHISGSVDAFADAMNEKAAGLGMNNTHFLNPHGLPEAGHYSTARDLALLMCEGLKNAAFAEISATQTKTISAPDGKSRFLSNHNRLLRTYEDCIAGKTGYTKEAGRCLVTAARQNGKTLVCATLGAPDDWNDHRALYRYGFSLYETRTLANIGDFCYCVPVVGGVESNLTVSNREGVSLPLREEDTVEMIVELPSFLYAPVTEGKEAGCVIFRLNGKEAARISLITEESVAQEEIPLGFWQKIWKKICEWFNFYGRD